MGKSAKHVRTKDGKNAVEFYDENGNKTSTNVDGKRPWRNNNPGNLQGGKGLQRGLNILNQANPLPGRSPAYGPYTKLGPVDEDGKYGPQTDFALKHATARLGPAKVQDGLALGRFNTFARQAQGSGNAEGLEAATHGAFGPLFRDKDDKSPKVEGGVLQETLNTIGPEHHDDWESLKVDDWIGPKTRTAFGRVLQSEDADRLFGSKGSMIDHS